MDQEIKRHGDGLRKQELHIVYGLAVHAVHSDHARIPHYKSRIDGRAIRTFKNHFVSVLASVYNNLSIY